MSMWLFIPIVIILAVGGLVAFVWLNLTGHYILGDGCLALSAILVYGMAMLNEALL